VREAATKAFDDAFAAPSDGEVRSVTEVTPEALRAELARIRSELSAMRARLDAIEPLVVGVPIIDRNIEALRHDARQIRAWVNDLAKL